MLPQTRPDDPGEPSTGQPRIGVDQTEAELLAFLVQGKHVLEIGTGVGRSAEAMSKTAKKVDTYDIDPWVHVNIFPILRHDFKVRCHAAIPPGLVWDVVFIDAEHSHEALTKDLKIAQEACPVGLHVVHDARDMAGTLELAGGFQILDTRFGLGLRYYGWT